MASVGSPESRPGPPAPGLLHVWGGGVGERGTPCPVPDLPSPRDTLPGSCGTQALRAWPCVPSTPAWPLAWAPAAGSSQEQSQGFKAMPPAGAVCPCSIPPSPGTGPSSLGSPPSSLRSPAAVEPEEGPLDSGDLGVQMGERPTGGTTLEAGLGCVAGALPLKWSPSGVGVSDSGLWASSSLPGPGPDSKNLPNEAYFCLVV